MPLVTRVFAVNFMNLVNTHGKVLSPNRKTLNVNC